MRKEVHAYFIVIAVMAAFCCGCNKDADLTPTGTAVQPSTPAAMNQQGQGGVKAANGGGAMPGFEPAAPGEKTGIPK